MQIERVRTGVPGLDDMLNGGIPKKHHTVLVGGPGTGKTTFGMQFLYKGVKDAGEKGAFISLEEQPARIMENVRQAFPGWLDFEELVKNKSLLIEKRQPLAAWSTGEKYAPGFEHFLDMVQSLVTQEGYKRVVIDSITILKLYFHSPSEFRRNVFQLMELVGNLDATLIFTAEAKSAERERLEFELEHYVADGVIALYNLPREEKLVRALQVHKMRGTSHSTKMVPLQFTPDGVVVYPEEKVY